MASFGSTTETVVPIKARNFCDIHALLLYHLAGSGGLTMRALRNAFLPTPIVDELGTLQEWGAVERSEPEIDDTDGSVIKPAVYGLTDLGREAIDECKRRGLPKVLEAPKPAPAKPAVPGVGGLQSTAKSKGGGGGGGEGR